MKQLATQAILLKRINYGEADRILTVLTKDSGQVSMLAKGVRKSNSKLAGGLELFSVTDINYIDGKSNLKTIISTRLNKHFKNIITDVSRTMAGYDFMKAIDVHAQHSSDTEYFELLQNGLMSLDTIGLSVALCDVWFYEKLLELNGSSLNTEKPLNKPKFNEDAFYEFSYDDMSFNESVNGKYGPNHIKFLRLVSRSSNPKQLTTISNFEKLAKDLQTIVKQSVLMHKA